MERDIFDEDYDDFEEEKEVKEYTAIFQKESDLYFLEEDNWYKYTFKDESVAKEVKRLYEL